jgi:DNA-directed RNA polymerase subunit M/transcription elongation factor TFIIS
VIGEDDDVDCPECGGPTMEIEANQPPRTYRQCQVCHYAWPVWP